jgi:transposase
VDKKGFILVSDVSNDETDDKNLIPQILQTKDNLDGLPEHIAWSFDNGYYSGSNIKFLNDKKINGYIPHTEKKIIHSFDKEHFTYNPSRNEYLCPAGQPVSFLKEKYDKDKKKNIRIYKGQKCRSCLHKRNCTKRKDGIRYIKSYPYEKERYAMRDKMRSNHGKESYKLRAMTVEPVFGDIKENKGVIGFLTRGIQTVKTEFNLICIASNMKKIWLQLQKKNNRSFDLTGCYQFLQV